MIEHELQQNLPFLATTRILVSRGASGDRERGSARNN